MDHPVDLLPTQYEGLTSPAFETLMVGGAGSGKTRGGSRITAWQVMQNPPGSDAMILAPLYSLLMDPVLPAMYEALHECQIPFEVKQAEHAIHLPGGRKIMWRSASDEAKLVGSNLAYVWGDEAAQFSQLAYNRLIQRVRELPPFDPRMYPHARLRMLWTSTHEGTRTWLAKRELDAGTSNNNVRVIRMPTRDNYLMHDAAGYVRRVMETYADNPTLMRQYLDGIAGDASGSIYTCMSSKNIRHMDMSEVLQGEIVGGGDFNTGWMITPLAAWFEHQQRLHIWGEVVSRPPTFPDGTTTFEHYRRVAEYLIAKGAAQPTRPMVPLHQPDYGMGTKRAIKPFHQPGMRIVQKNTGTKITIVIDPAGGDDVNSSGFSDEAAINANGFDTWSVSHPLVRDRIAAVQSAFRGIKLTIDPDAAPDTYRSFREHARDNRGKPKKHWAVGEFQADHGCDAGGYLTWRYFPAVGAARWGG